MEFVTIILVLAGILGLVLFVHFDTKKAMQKEYDYMFKQYTDAYNKSTALAMENTELKIENEQLKEQIVPRETYNKSFGDPDITRWIDQTYGREDN